MTRILLIHTAYDTPFLPRLKDAIGGISCLLFKDQISSRTEVIRLCKSRGITQVLCTRESLLPLFIQKTSSKKPSLSNYAGSLFKVDGIEVVFIPPLEQLITVSYGKFIFRRYLSKFTQPDLWLEAPPFIWEELDESNFAGILKDYESAFAIAVDIETGKEPEIHIKEIGFSSIHISASGEVSIHSCVLILDSMSKLAMARQLCDLPAPKIMQNGKYDCSYLSRYNIIPRNYLWDTATIFHSWYSELPKDLAFLGAFFCREAMYWKDLAASSDKRDQLLYNCKDTYTTALAFLQMMKEIPPWAISNYSNEFPLLFPCHMAEMTGIAIDLDELEVAADEQKSLITGNQESLDKILGCSFNVNSPVQMKQLLALLGCKDLESADAKNLAKASLRHPLNALVIGKVLKIRKARKLLSTYLTKGKEFYGSGLRKNSRPRILYSLNPHGTDTGRLASKEHHFWCGLQIQNIPRGTAVKRICVADDGYLLVECDLEQAESRDTAHIAGDENLIAAVTSDKDFHSVNASAFFGVPYDSIFDVDKGKPRDKALRDLAKRVNHGANYNMGPNILVETMGLDKIWEAQRLLKLPKFWMPKQVAEFLLAQFHKAYPLISGKYYPKVIADVVRNRMLSSDAEHDAPYQASKKGWTRYCFGSPDKNKSDLNAYVAHCPQSLNAMTLNKAFMWIFYALAFKEEFKLMAQIHDSIFFQVKIGHEYLIQEVVDRMQIPVKVTGADGKVRQFAVPAAAKAGPDNKGALRWSQTE